MERFTARAGRPPGLAVVLAGNDPASEIYVRNKIATVRRAWLSGRAVPTVRDREPGRCAGAGQAAERGRPVDAILVQSPLPPGMGPDAEQRVFDAMDPAKDVDGFHPINVGRLVQKRPALVACTPLGCAELLDREKIPLAAGTPSSSAGATSSVSRWRCCCCIGTRPSRSATRGRGTCRGVPIGRRPGGGHRPARIRHAAFVKPGATVIDVGINRLQTAADVRGALPRTAQARQFAQKGSVLVGDVHPAVEEVAGAMTPVPGGVGPLTIAMVLRNTVTAAELRAGASA